MNNLYTFGQPEIHIDNFQISCQIYANHEVFKGHFPGKPVLPGAVMLQIIKEVMEIKLDAKILLEHVSQLKFIQMICPEQDIELKIIVKEKKQGYSAEIIFQEAVCLKSDFKIKML